MKANMLNRLRSRALDWVFDMLFRRRVEAIFAHDALFRVRVLGDATRLKIAPSAEVQNALFNTNSGRIQVGQNSFFGHDVAILTGAHDPTKLGIERKRFPTSGRDIVIGDGVWIASRAVVLGPCRIGDNAVIAAGAVVCSDVPACTLVGGVPARTIKRIELT